MKKEITQKVAERPAQPEPAFASGRYLGKGILTVLSSYAN